ncbi:MAG: thiamine phosphate synthase [Actinobacteria bacterium]|nr:thiamine phosphate synthase [Actinomycetota bacterium]
MYFITDSKLTKKGIIEDVREAIEAGVKIVQYREKEKSTRKMFEEARRIKNLCKQNGVLFIVNDRVDISLAVDADGVHLGDEDMPYEVARKILGVEKIIGLTVHDIEEAVLAEKMGADYIGLSPIFETKTKPDAGKPSGLEFIRMAKEKITIPFVAIGGINESNIESVLDAGATSVAIISAIVGKDDVERECKKFREIILRHGGGEL